jgi:hypothetical protein
VASPNISQTAQALRRLFRVVEGIGQDEPAVRQASAVKDALSGAFGKEIPVKAGVDGGMFALIPSADLVTSGLVVSESCIAGVPPVLSGCADAVTNAERRVAKRIGEGVTARLAGFDPNTKRVSFEVIRAQAAAQGSDT